MKQKTQNSLVSCLHERHVSETFLEIPTLKINNNKQQQKKHNKYLQKFSYFFAYPFSEKNQRFPCP